MTRDSFDPAREERTFRIGLSAELEVLLLPALVARLRRDAPGLRVLARPMSRGAVNATLDDGTVDFAVGCFEQAMSWHSRQPLFEETHLCCFHPDQLSISAPVSVADYVAAPHALVSLKDSLFGCLEDALGRAGTSLSVVSAAPHFLSALESAAQAPLLTTLPRRVVERFAPKFGFSISPLPVALETFSVGLLWHARTTRDTASAWMRNQVADTSTDDA